MTQSQLISKILAASKAIHESSLRSPASWLCTNSETLDILKKISNSHQRDEKINSLLESVIYEDDKLKIIYNIASNEAKLFRYGILKCVIFNIDDHKINFLLKKYE